MSVSGKKNQKQNKKFIHGNFNLLICAMKEHISVTYLALGLQVRMRPGPVYGGEELPMSLRFNNQFENYP